MSQLWWEFCATPDPAAFKAREVSTFDQADFQSARLWSSRLMTSAAVDAVVADDNGRLPVETITVTASRNETTSWLR
jgi:hypothetical protein